MITYICTCGKQYAMADDAVGTKVRCPACGVVGEVPAPFTPQPLDSQLSTQIAVPAPPLAPGPPPPPPPPSEPFSWEPGRRSLLPQILASAVIGAVCLLAIGLYLRHRSAARRPPVATSPTTRAAATPRRVEQAEATPAPKARVATKASAQSKALPTTASSPSATKTPPPPAKAMDPADLFRTVSPAVVRVEIYDKDFRPTSQGSGFFVSPDGLIVTNYHVIANAQFATVLLSNELKCLVEGVVAWDRDADLAVLKIQGKQLPCLDASAAQLPEVGAKVYAIGSPKGLTNTLSEGLVSGHREMHPGLPAIQTTAAISPGSSGGPLLAADGKVVGVTTRVLQGGQNLNFAVPADRVAKLLASRGGPRSFASVREADSNPRFSTGPTEPDPLGFAGTWIEHWPGVVDHDINVVTFWKGQYSVQVRNPRSGPYRIDNVRVDGGALKFTEYPGPEVAIDYEVRIQDRNTCMVRTYGGPNRNVGVLWIRDAAAPVPAAPPGPKDLVATLKWQTIGTDVDLLLIGPNKQMIPAVRDCLSGPGEETCIVRGPAPGEYKVIAMYPDSKGGQVTQATIGVQLGGKAIGTYQVLLTRDRETKLVTTVMVPP